MCDVTEIAPDFIMLNEEEKIEVLYKSLEERAKAIKKILQWRSISFLMIVIRETDDILHSFRHYIDENHLFLKAINMKKQFTISSIKQMES